MKKTLVIGASSNPERYSYKAIKLLVQHQITVQAIGLKAAVVAGVEIQTGHPDLKDIDTVTLYVNAKRQPEFYTYILGLQPRRVLFNPGTENPEFYKLLEAQNIIVEEACTLVLLSTSQY